jgi:hypothetical protein
MAARDKYLDENCIWSKQMEMVWMLEVAMVASTWQDRANAD